MNYEPTYPFSLYPMFPINGVAVASNGAMVAAAVGAGDSAHPSRGEVIVWNFATGDEQLRIPSTEIAFSAVAFSPDGNTLASASGNSVKLWRTTGDDISAELESLVSLERRVRTIADVDAQQQQRILDDTQAYLAAKVAEGLLQRDIILAAFIGQRLRDAGNPELAAEAFRRFAAELAESKSR